MNLPIKLDLILWHLRSFKLDLLKCFSFYYIFRDEHFPNKYFEVFEVFNYKFNLSRDRINRDSESLYLK